MLPSAGGRAEGARTPCEDVTRQLGGVGASPASCLVPTTSQVSRDARSHGAKKHVADAGCRPPSGAPANTYRVSPRASPPQGLQSLKPNSEMGHPEPHGLDSRLAVGRSVKGVLAGGLGLG